jgi:hypothetical protein
VSEENAQSFEDFFREWKKENVRALYDQRIDPSDREYLIRRRSERLIEAARERGQYAALLREIGNSKSVRDYVAALFERADWMKREGMGFLE